MARKKRSNNTTNTTSPKGGRWKKRASKAMKAIPDAMTVAEGAKDLKPLKGVRSFSKQVSEGNYPFSGRYNRTKDLVAVTSDAMVNSAQNLNQLWRSTGMDTPGESRDQGSSYNDPNFTTNQSRTASSGGNMGNRNFARDGASGQHPSRQYSSDSSAVPINPFSDTTVTTSPIRLSSYLERQYQLNPYLDQKGAVVNDQNNSTTWRTLFNLIDTTKAAVLDFSTNTRVQYAFRRIYMQLRQELIEAVNANQFTNQVFNSDNFEAYLQQVIEAWALYAEVKTRMSFRSSYAEQNLVLRNLSGSMAGDTNLLVAIEKLETILKKFALPIKVIEYYKWLFQTYKATPVEGGLHYSAMSSYVYSACYDSKDDSADWSDLVVKINDVTEALYDSTDYNGSIGNWPTMSQYLVKFCKTGKWTDVGNCLTFCSEPIYDVNTNAIWDNKVSYVDPNNNTPMYGRYTQIEDAQVAFPHDEDCVPAFVTAHLLPLWGVMDFNAKVGQTGGFPFWSTYMLGAHVSGENPVHQLGQNTVIFETSALGGGAGWGIHTVNQPNEFITDHIWSWCYDGVGNAFGMLRAKGLNTRYYSPSYTNTTTACVNFMYDAFGLDLDYS